MADNKSEKQNDYVIPDPKGMVIPYDIEPFVDALKDEEVAMLFRSMLRYGQTGDDVYNFNGILSVVWKYMKPKIDQDKEKFKTKCWNNHLAALEKAKKDSERKHSLTDGNECKHSLTVADDCNQTLTDGNESLPNQNNTNQNNTNQIEIDKKKEKLEGEYWNQ